MVPFEHFAIFVVELVLFFVLIRQGAGVVWAQGATLQMGSVS